MRKTTVGRVGESGTYIGRPTAFGNPYTIDKDGTREEVIEKYRAHLLRKIKANPAFRKKLKALRGRHLVCYCSPLACHGDVIAEYLDGLTEEEFDEL